MIKGKYVFVFLLFIAYLFITPSFICCEATAGEIEIGSSTLDVAAAQFDKAAEIKKALGLKESWRRGSRAGPGSGTADVVFCEPEKHLSGS